MINAYTSATPQAQWVLGMQCFLSGQPWNRFADGKPQVSRIYKWFKQDFEKGHKGFTKVEDFFAKYADLLGPDAASINQIRAKSVPISYLAYD